MMDAYPEISAHLCQFIQMAWFVDSWVEASYSFPANRDAEARANES